MLIESGDSERLKLNKLAKRTIVGSILGLIIAVVLYVHPLALFIVSLIWVALATNEFLRMLEAKQIFINRLLMILLNILVPTIFYFTYLFRTSPPIRSYNILYILLPLVFFLYAMIKREKYFLIVPFGLFTLFYLGFLPSHLVFLKVWAWQQHFSHWHSFFIVFFPLGFTWLNDTAAYLVGSLIGRHKLASKISPNKTIEGFVGSIIVSIIFSFFYLRALFPQTATWLLMAIGLVLSIAAQLGDLVESGFKRDANLKDSSNALGEHGGFLDRVDSLLFTVPVFYYILLYIIF
jgi:phosphatidate cytidylyltransferase